MLNLRDLEILELKEEDMPIISTNNVILLKGFTIFL